MRRSTIGNWMAMAAVAALAIAGTAPSARAHEGDFVASGYAGARVWVDGGDVFHDYDDVSIYVRVDRDCYATLLLVDTDGYMHVLHPSSPYERAWFRGGRTYRYDACDLGLDRLHGVGVAHLFLVSSPVPFDYSYYGASVFIGGFGFRVYGDPYVACRDFYLTLLPSSCRWDFVGIGCARFYVRRWVRYPSYLCSVGTGLHVRIGDSCRECSGVYVSYRASVANPYESMRPAPKFKRTYAERSVGGMETSRVKSFARVERRERGHEDAWVRGQVQVRSRETRAPGAETRVGAKVKVVSTSRAGDTARATVKVSSRSVKASPTMGRGERTERVRPDAGKSAGTASRQKGGAKQARHAD